jgi:hypothetical protein
MISAIIFEKTESIVIPRQLLQCLRLPFFGSLTLNPSFHSSGYFSLSQIAKSMFAVTLGSALRISAGIWSTLAVLLFLSFMMAALISSPASFPSSVPLVDLWLPGKLESTVSIF